LIIHKKQLEAYVKSVTDFVKEQAYIKPKGRSAMPLKFTAFERIFTLQTAFNPGLPALLQFSSGNRKRTRRKRVKIYSLFGNLAERAK